MRDIFMWYILVGLIYYSYNLIIRKLHLKNEEHEGWYLVPFWIFGWPLCFILLFSALISDKTKSNKV